MHRFLFITIFLAAFVWFAIACNASPTPTATALAPTQIPATAIPTTAVPSPTLSPTIAPSATPINYDGFWDGATTDGRLNGAFQFVVENNVVTEILFNYTLRSGGCTNLSVLSGTADESFIQGNEIHATMLIEGGDVFSFNGAFTAPQQAQGTLTYKGDLQGCGKFEKTVQWNASNVPFPPTETPTPIPPTEAPTLTPTATRTAPPTQESKTATPEPNITVTINTYDTRFPLPADVRNFTRGDADAEQINYQTQLTLDEILKFYRGALSELGATEDTRMTTIDSKVISIVFDGWAPHKWLILQAVDLGELRNVNLRLEDAP